MIFIPTIFRPLIAAALYFLQNITNVPLYNFIIARLLITALRKKINSDNRCLGGKGHSAG